MGGVSEWYRSVIAQAPRSQQLHPNKAAAPARALGRAPHDHGALPLNRAMHPSFPPLCLDVPVYRGQTSHARFKAGHLASRAALQGTTCEAKFKIHSTKRGANGLEGGSWRWLATAQRTATRPPQRSFFFTEPRHPEWRQLLSWLRFSGSSWARRDIEFLMPRLQRVQPGLSR